METDTNIKQKDMSLIDAINEGKEIITDSGDNVKILATDLDGDYPIVALIKDSSIMSSDEDYKALFFSLDG